jgi:TM2 domain-containing membrane protein YozV
VLARAEGSWRAIRPVPPLDLVADLQPLEGHDGAPYQILAGYHLSRLHLALADRGRAREVLARNQRRCARGDRPGCEPLAALEGPLAWAPPVRRSAALGALLSAAVPGLGALYARRPVDAITYFLLTVGTGLLAWDVHDPARGPGAQKPSFYVLGVTAATFYLSSVAQGWLGVERTNEVDEWAHRQRVLQATELALPDPASIR